MPFGEKYGVEQDYYRRGREGVLRDGATDAQRTVNCRRRWTYEFVGFR